MENLNESNDDLEFQLLREVSKGLLMRVLEGEDYESNKMAKASLAYMAALHFATSENHIAIDLSWIVIMDEYCEKEDNDTLNAGCMLYIEDIAIIIDFYLIFMKTREASLHYTRRQFLVDLRLTPELTA